MLGFHRFMLRLRRRFDEVQVCGKGILNRTGERILWTEAIVDGWEDRRQITHMKGGKVPKERMINES